MKKIININLSGRVIPIEDSAYENLKSYVESLRRYFANEESREEIINDIESRIAELMSEKVRKGASCITDADVEEIISSMGRPEDFEAEEAAQKTTNVKPNQAQQESSSSNSSTSTAQSERTQSRRRLYRDSSDKFIGGVCSGIAAYLNVDPAIVRILFAIVTFGGFGVGFLVYILLWIVLPPKDLEGYRGKRLYRNPDDRVIAGVAGGLSAYFNMKSRTLRLIFIAPVLLSMFFAMIEDNNFDVFPNVVFGSLSATFFFAYVVLWMVLPEANSAYEKMEMRGEKVDVNRIRQNVKESAEGMKDKVKGWSEEVKETAQNFGDKAKEFANTRGKAFAQEFGDTARRGGRGLGHVIGVLFKAFFLFIAGTIAFGFLVAIIALIFSGVFWWPINNFLWTSGTQQLYAWGTLIFFFGVPLIAFMVWLIRRIIRVRSKSNYLGWTFGFLWTIGWIVAVLFAVSFSKDFSRHRSAETTTIEITQPPTGKMILKVNEPELLYTGRFDWFDEVEGWDLTEDTMKLSNVDFDFELSKDSSYHVYVKRFSSGRTVQEAMNRANKIQFNVTSNDSILNLANGYAIDKETKFRMQHVVVEIHIPAGKKIRFDRSVNEKLNPGNFDFGEDWDRKNGRDYYRSQFLTSNTDYIMTADGTLKDESGKKVRERDDDYRYRDQEQDTQRISPSTEILEQDKRTSVVISRKKRGADFELASGSPSPVISVGTLIN